MSRISQAFAVVLVFVSTGVASAYSNGNPPQLVAELSEATVTVKFPATEFDVGDEKPFVVVVTPTPGNPAPSNVRGRFGMPFMHHWVTEEVSTPYTEGGLEFMSKISMYGVYRFRIWIDYADGHETKTAVDFKVMTDEGLDPTLVE